MKIGLVGGTLIGMDIIDQDLWLRRLRERKNPFHPTYRAMYSTWWGGIVTDPVLMVVPVDDHQVHRGDAVFEAMKVVDGRIWLNKEHLDRLSASAAQIGLELPMSRASLEDAIRHTLKASELGDAYVRIFLTRGPGSFSTNPYDSVGAQVHVIVTEMKPLPAVKIEGGVSIGLSRVPVKDPWLARIKSCNYLPNVLMKKEAVDRGIDFTIGVDASGVLTEGSTENFFVVDRDGVLIRPKPEGILAGTTLQRAFDLAEPLVGQGLLKDRRRSDLNLDDIREAREVMMAGTTLDVIAVTSVEGQPVGDGKPGPVARKLRELLLADQTSS